ncbi:thioredoxin-like domain-containing protein [Schlesneria paludicola]|uniref:thioredoxin-like domain-containing protein n=1 Tax=Schlesneria paludicola TaxID=360056 RepID=UPI00029B3550|nr:thioredoxin-like domain-containing protein [Schlesneria paludicola]
MNIALLCLNALRQRASKFVLLALVLALVCHRPALSADDADPKKAPKPPNADEVENPFPNRHPAPDLDGGVEWLNSSGPISIKDLRGKIVLIDFWTFCCINCMHVLPDLAYLEKKFPNELVVVGVHSAKFDNEKETGNIRNAIVRYEIEHPVVNDANMTIWRKFGVRSWPTLAVIDPEGQYCGFVSGEGNRELLEKVVEKLIAYHKSKKTLDETPLHFDLERNKSVSEPLRYPGKILADAANDRLFISDSNHNRLIVCTLTGKLIDVIGSGAIGHKDGGYAVAQFDHPQGMTLVGDTLYVADTENHLLRAIDLKQKHVSTFAGVGEQARTRAPGGTLRETALNSPWDLTVVDGVMYIAMAGPHQVWAHKLGTNTLAQYAGSGREDITNGELDQSALAQPSGIVHDGQTLYVVDSEGSAVRAITTDAKNDLSDPKGMVTTIAGPHDLPRGRSLFEFGNIDGSGDEVRFQHPLGLVHHDGSLFVADSYNHQVRQVDLKTRAVSTWAGTGKPGRELAPVQFAEPAGLAIANGTLYVADTNNHRIVLIDLATKNASELAIEGLTAPSPTADEPEPQAVTLASTKATDVERQVLVAANGIPFQIDFELPEGFKLNELLPVSYRLKADGSQKLVAKAQLGVKHEGKSSGVSANFTVPTTMTNGEAKLTLAVTYGYCRDGEGGVCKIATKTWSIPVVLQDGAKQDVIKLTAKPAK